MTVYQSDSRTQWVVCPQLSQGVLELPVGVHCAQDTQGGERSLGPLSWATPVPAMGKSPAINVTTFQVLGGLKLVTQL